MEALQALHPASKIQVPWASVNLVLRDALGSSPVTEIFITG